MYGSCSASSTLIAASGCLNVLEKSTGVGRQLPRRLSGSFWQLGRSGRWPFRQEMTSQAGAPVGGGGGGWVLPHSKGRVSFWKSSRKLCQFECLSVRGRRAGRRRLRLRLRLSHENAKMTLRSNRSEGIEASVLIVAIEASKVPVFPETCAFALVVHMRRSVYDCFGLCNLLSHQPSTRCRESFMLHLLHE